MKNIIDLRTYVLEQSESIKNAPEAFDKYVNIVNYAKFLSMPLELKMFVPIDKNGNILKGKPLSPATDDEWDRWEKEQPKFDKAKAEVIFEGFEIETDMYKQTKRSIIWMPDRIHQVYRKLEFCNGEVKTFLFNEEFKDVESLIKFNLTLTEQAIDKYKF